jgi:predicted neutral ceramidase superfamily lipid hydrolase
MQIRNIIFQVLNFLPLSNFHLQFLLSLSTVGLLPMSPLLIGRLIFIVVRLCAFRVYVHLARVKVDSTKYCLSLMVLGYPYELFSFLLGLL